MQNLLKNSKIVESQNYDGYETSPDFLGVRGGGILVETNSDHQITWKIEKKNIKFQGFKALLGTYTKCKTVLKRENTENDQIRRHLCNYSLFLCKINLVLILTHRVSA